MISPRKKRIKGIIIVLLLVGALCCAIVLVNLIGPDGIITMDEMVNKSTDGGNLEYKVDRIGEIALQVADNLEEAHKTYYSQVQTGADIVAEGLRDAARTQGDRVITKLNYGGVVKIENGEIGRALALGVTPAKVEIVHEEDLCAEPVPGSASGAMRSTNVGYARIVWKEDGTGEKWCFLRLGASEPRADEKSIDFAVRDPETEEDEDAAKTEKLEIKGFSSKEAEDETLGDILSKADEPKTGPEEEEPEDEVIVRSGDRKKVKFLKIGRGAASVEVDDISVDFTRKDAESEGSDERTNKVQVYGFDSKDADETSLADHLAEQDVECEDEVVVRAADRKALRYLKIGGKLATVLEAGDNVTITRDGNTITISAEGGAEPDDFVTSGYSTAEGGSDVEIAAIRYYDHQLQVKKAVKVYENGLLKTRVVGEWETFTTAVEETV